MNALLFDSIKNETIEIPDSTIIHVEKDSENFLSIYTTGGVLYLILDEEDINRINNTWKGEVVK